MYLRESNIRSHKLDFVPTSWVCKKQTSVSHSSTESEVIFLDAGLRMDGVEDALLMSLQSSNQDLSLEDEKANKEDRPSSSHLSIHSGTIQMKKNLARTSRSREKYTFTVSGK